jgi:alpha-galactosidase/6-phospho-beta-glucosidase family protein
MKIAIIGAAGVRTPLIIQAIVKRQGSLKIDELSLMDIDGERLELIGALTALLERSSECKFKINRTTDPIQALSNTNFVITTFRVGGFESRIIDERVPLNHGILGQETTGPGGFAMAMRSIRVILDYVQLMEKVCPDAWLINFANPAGLLTEAVTRNSTWRRIVGICDAPASMHRVIAAVLNADPSEIYLDYFGLNHLGWIKRVIHHQQDLLPTLLQMIETAGSVPGLPFDVQLIHNLRMIPNEYLYYYYYAVHAVKHIQEASECRGEQIARQNRLLFKELKEKFATQDIEGMQRAYQNYLNTRGTTYMVTETGKTHDFSSLQPEIMQNLQDEGYAGVALDLIEALSGICTRTQILNVPNQGAILGMDASDVVEIPTMVSLDRIQSLAVGEIPDHCLGLIKQVKAYERLTIDASQERSYQKARLSLTLHPLVRDERLAGNILDEYISLHQGYFSTLK